MVKYKDRVESYQPAPDKAWGYLQPEWIMKAATWWGCSRCNMSYQHWEQFWSRSLYSENSNYHTCFGSCIGLREYQQEEARLHEGFPDYKLVLDDMIAEGPVLAVRFHFEGTHTGNFYGIPPTGKHGTMRVHEIDHFMNGIDTEGWGHADVLDFMQQLGVVPPIKDTRKEPAPK